MQRITWLFLAGALVCAGCGSKAPQGPGPSVTGIVGQVFRGPTQPVCVIDEPCDETFAASFHVYHDDLNVVDFQTGPDGKFRLDVAPGEYIIAPDASAPILCPEGQTRAVTVPEGSVVTVRLDFDTGIL